MQAQEPITYIDDPSTAAICVPPRERVCFFAPGWTTAPGSKEEIVYRVGPSKCGAYDVLWVTGENQEAASGVAWLPEGQLGERALWTILLKASQWGAEKKEDLCAGPKTRK